MLLKDIYVFSFGGHFPSAERNGLHVMAEGIFKNIYMKLF